VSERWWDFPDDEFGYVVALSDHAISIAVGSTMMTSLYKAMVYSVLTLMECYIVSMCERTF